MAKPDRGTKRQCPNCGTKYYDLNRDPIVCPRCSTVFVVAPSGNSEKPKPEQAPPPPPEKEEVVVDKAAEAAGAEVISLDEAEAEEGEEEEDGEETIPDVEDVEDVEDIGDDDEDAFLEEDEDDDRIGFDVPVKKSDDT